MSDDDDTWEPSRGGNWIIFLSSALPTCGLIALFWLAAYNTDKWYVGKRSLGYVQVSRSDALMVVYPTLALMTLIAVVKFGAVAIALLKTASVPASRVKSISPDESVVWAGRLGWRSITAPRVVIMTLVTLPIVLCAWWLLSIVQSPRGLYAKVAIGGWPTLLLCGTAIPIFVVAWKSIKGWLRDIVAIIRITNERITWHAFGKEEPYREISSEEIVDVALVRQTATRGSLTIIRRKEDDVVHIEINGVREPEHALAAIQALIR